MKRLRIGTALVVLGAMLAFAGGASASRSDVVTITVLTHIEGFEVPFEATGDVVCDEGTVADAGGNFVGWRSQTHAQIILIKHFECPEGTFDVLLRVKLDFATGDTVGTWSVLDGTEAYATLRGSGSLTGDGISDVTILDVYVGTMHFD